MTETDLLEIARQSVWVILLVSAPLLLVATVVGGLIALLQALTTIQEMTLTFVPKMAAMMMALLLLLPFMLTTLIEFTQQLFAQMAHSG